MKKLTGFDIVEESTVGKMYIVCEIGNEISWKIIGMYNEDQMEGLRTEIEQAGEFILKEAKETALSMSMMFGALTDDNEKGELYKTVYVAIPITDQIKTIGRYPIFEESKDD